MLYILEHLATKQNQYTCVEVKIVFIRALQK